MSKLMQSPMAALYILLVFTLPLSACSVVEASDEEIEEQWLTSAHADAESRAFTRWDDDDPAEIPESCAKCHSTYGYRDFLGLDGSTPGQVDQPVPVGEILLEHGVPEARLRVRDLAQHVPALVGVVPHRLHVFQGRQRPGIHLLEMALA